MFYSLFIVAVALLMMSVRHWQLIRVLAQRDKEIALLRRQGSDFVANVSHELKTPLTSIKGYTETVKSMVKKDPEKAIEFLTRIEENSERLSLLINDILELSRVEAPNFYIEKVTFKIEPLLDEIKERFNFPLSSRRQILVIKNSVESLNADRWLVDQALGNLIENSHRYCPEEAVIEVSVSSVTENGKNFVQFQVSDNGPGIKEEDLSRIFERFYRVDKSRNRLSGGTGLGLAIAKHILLSHGGQVRVSSQPGQGATFFLLFPRST